MHSCVTCLQLALRFSVPLAWTRRSGKTLSIGRVSKKANLADTLSSRHRIKTNLLPKLSRSPRPSKRKCLILSKSFIANPPPSIKSRSGSYCTCRASSGPVLQQHAEPSTATRFSHRQSRVIAQHWCAFASSYSCAVRSRRPDCPHWPSAAQCRMPPSLRPYANSLRSRPAAFAR